MQVTKHEVEAGSDFSLFIPALYTQPPRGNQSDL